MGEIYSPLEDSFFFAEFLRKILKRKKDKKIKYLDMGCGSGILSMEASKFLGKENILAVDINPDAVNMVREKGFEVIKSDLFEEVDGKFDLITFNAPYLPIDERETEESSLITAGGKKGDEVSLRFLAEAYEHLSEEGVIFLLISSLTPTKRIKKYDGKKVTSKKLFFEELHIYEFKK